MILCGRKSFDTIVCLVILCATLFAGSARGQAPLPSHDELQVLLKRMAQQIAANEKLSQQYTSEELWHNVNFNKDGKKTVDESAKYENIFVEGLGYRRKVEQNGKPLEGKGAEEEEKRYSKAVMERRAMSWTEKRHLFQTHSTFEFPLDWLATLFDNHIIGREQINGRDTLVIESTPLLNVHPSSEAEQQHVLDMKEKTWIDSADAMPVRIEVEMLKDRGHVEKGSTFALEFQRVIDQPASDGRPVRPVWLIHSSVVCISGKLLFVKIHGTTEQTWSNYKRFHVDVRLLEDSVQEAPATRKETDKP